MSAKFLTIFMFLGILAFSACSPAVTEEAPAPVLPTQEASVPEVPTEEITNQPVPVLGHDQARDVIVKYLADQNGLTPPAEWQSVDQTPNNLVGSSKTMFVGDGWTVMVSAPVVAPEYLVYQIEVSDLATGLLWKGTVDAFEKVTEESFSPPISVGSPEQARDLAVKFVAESQTLDFPPEWTRQLDKVVDGSVLVTFTGGPWVVQVSYMPSAPIVGEYQIVIDHMQAVIRWQGKVDAHGNLDGSFVAGS